MTAAAGGTGVDAEAYLICVECRLGLMLGSTTAHPDMTITAISAPPRVLGTFSLMDATVARAAWRLITEHAGHTMRVLADCWHQFDTYIVTDFACVYPSVPTDRPAYDATAVTLHAYTNGWPRKPTLATYRGSTPAPGRLVPPPDGGSTEASLFCLPCRIAVDIGDITVRADRTITVPTAGRHPTHRDDSAAAALGRLFAEHAGHDLLAIAYNSTLYDEYLDAGEWLLNIERSPEKVEHRGDLTWAEYVDGWPDQPAYPRHLGLTPVARRCCVSGGRIHQGCHHAPPPPLDLAALKIPVTRKTAASTAAPDPVPADDRAGTRGAPALQTTSAWGSS